MGDKSRPEGIIHDRNKFGTRARPRPTRHPHQLPSLEIPVWVSVVPNMMSVAVMAVVVVGGGVGDLHIGGAVVAFEQTAA